MNVIKKSNVFWLCQRYASSETALANDLKCIVGNENVSNLTAIREQHSHDESYYPGQSPDAVVYPLSTKHVSDVVKFCASKQIPIILFGTDTGIEGGVHAIYGGVYLNLTRMNKVLEVSPEYFDCTVQAGVQRKTLNAYIRNTGIQFPIDPGADASLGGMCATSASGTMIVRYGTMQSLRLNGKITGEHGIGLGKKKLLIDEFDLAGINTMKSIKKALDPLNILNPGKVLDI